MNKCVCAATSMLCSVILLNSLLWAQEPAAPPPREGTAEFSFVATGGNATTQALGLGAEYIVREAPWEFRGKVAYVRNESENVVNAEAFSGALRAGRAISDRLSAFGQYGYLHDRFAGIESRNTVDAGITYAIVRPEPHALDVDLGLGYADENRIVGEDISTASGLAGARYQYTLSKTAEFTDDLGFTLSFSHSDDWRMTNQASLTAEVNTVLSMKLSNRVRYVNAPAPGFETTDTVTSIALVAKF